MNEPRDKHGALKALDNFYDQLSATEPRRALLKLYDHARQLARTVDELSSRSATAPIADEFNTFWAFRFKDGSYWTDDMFDSRERAESWVQYGDGVFVEGAELVEVVFVPKSAVTEIAAICQLDGCRARRAEERRSQDDDRVLRVRNAIAGRALRWEGQEGIFSGRIIADELRFWVDELDGAMTPLPDGPSAP